MNTLNPKSQDSLETKASSPADAAMNSSKLSLILGVNDILVWYIQSAPML